MIHRAHHAAPSRRREPAETALEAINRLEDERNALWRRGVTTEAQAARLSEINRELSALWQRRRREQAEGNRG